MLVRCPECHVAARIVASEEITTRLRRAYCQCKNINCSTTFAVSIETTHIIKSPMQGSDPPAHQPELLSNSNQLDLLTQQGMQ